MLGTAKGVRGTPMRVLLALMALLGAVAAAGYGVRDARADGTFSLSASTYTVDEGEAVAITINRSGGTAIVAVTLTLTDGSAHAGTDYLSGSPYTFFFNPADPNPNTRTISVSTIENTSTDGNRTFTATISVGSGSSVGSPSSATITIVDDDGPPKYSFQAATSSVTEGNSGSQLHQVAVVRTGATSGTDSVTCKLAASPGTAASGVDYTFTNQTITFNPGDTGPKYCAVTIMGDTTPEANETIVLELGTPTSGFGGGAGSITQHTVTIVDDDGAGSIQFTSATYSGPEAGGPIVITVSRTGGTAGVVTVQYATVTGGTASPGDDYVATSGTLTWANGDGANKTFTVTPVVDTLIEGPETVILQLGSPTGGAVLGTPSTATLTITDSTGLPVITSIVPGAGPTTGGTTVTISGQNFTGATSVTFDGIPCTSLNVVSATTITCVTPAHAAGTVEVVVTTPAGSNSTAGSANDFLYVTGPVVTALSPTSGACNGATIVTITGANFTSSGMTVVFGTVPATFTYLSSTQIVAVAPAQGAGVVDVRVTTPGGTSPNTVADDFTCTGTPVPTVTGLSPTSGPVGTTVTITGTNFVGVTQVTFGGVAATFAVVNSTTITATVPAGTPAGVVDVRVTNAGGTSANTAADDFTNTSTSTTTYTLYRTFTLIVWVGADNKPISQAIGGTQAGTTNISGLVGAIWRFNPQTQSWLGYFPGSEGVPGANDFTTFRAGTAYFIALRPTAPATVSWVAPAN